jgi:outer membrane biosynthesis protein TonB
MPLIRLLADQEDEDKLPPPPPLLRGAEFHVESLLLELSEERRKRRRQAAAFWSIIGHLAVIILLLLSPKLFGPVVVHLPSPQQDLEQQPQLTFLELPKDLVKPKPPVNPKALSDQNRHFERQDKIRDSLSTPAPRLAPKPIPAVPPPGPVTKQPPVTAPPPQPPAAPPAAAPKEQPKAEPPGLKLEDVPKPLANPQLKLNISPATALQRAIEGAARDGARGQRSMTQITPLPQPPAGSGSSSPGETGAGVEILTDTQGVDFSSYLQRVIEIVRRNWYAVMPEAVYLGAQGRVVVVFNIASNGSIPQPPGVRPTSLSGQAALDQAAQASISASNPFPPLPPAFHGPVITLQFSFYYNLTPPGQN